MATRTRGGFRMEAEAVRPCDGEAVDLSLGGGGGDGSSPLLLRRGGGGGGGGGGWDGMIRVSQ